MSVRETTEPAVDRRPLYIFLGAIGLLVVATSAIFAGSPALGAILLVVSLLLIGVAAALVIRGSRD